MYYSRAFSLMELLTVVTIIGVLAIFAVPSYERYVVKANVAGLLSTASNYKVKIIENNWADMAHKNIIEKINTSTIETITLHSTDSNPAKYVIQVVAKMRDQEERGIGLKQPRNAKAPLMLQMHGLEVNGALVWSCHVATEYYEYAPSICKSGNLEVVSAT